MLETERHNRIGLAPFACTVKEVEFLLQGLFSGIGTNYCKRRIVKVVIGVVSREADFIQILEIDLLIDCFKLAIGSALGSFVRDIIVLRIAGLAGNAYQVIRFPICINHTGAHFGFFNAACESGGYRPIRQILVLVVIAGTHTQQECGCRK